MGNLVYALKYSYKYYSYNIFCTLENLNGSILKQ